MQGGCGTPEVWQGRGKPPPAQERATCSASLPLTTRSRPGRQWEQRVRSTGALESFQGLSARPSTLVGTVRQVDSWTVWETVRFSYLAALQRACTGGLT